MSIPKVLADFYPKDTDSVNSFIDLYILIEKLMKMIHFRNEAMEHNTEAVDLGSRALPVQFESDLKVIKLKCKSEMRSALGKVLPLPDTVLDKVLGSILHDDDNSLEEYKFEEVSVEDIGEIKMMYGSLTSIFLRLRDEVEASVGSAVGGVRKIILIKNNIALIF